MFGVANQLLSAIAFGVGTIVIIKAGKLKYAWVTFIPMIFMFSTTLTASWILVGMFREKAATALSQSEALTYGIDAFLVFLMATLAVVVLTDMSYKLYCQLSGKSEPAGQKTD